MLFDLKGRRRRVIQGTYLMLAVLMGGGLVLFGIGGEVQGGLVDAFTGGSSGDAGSGPVADRVEASEERLRSNPRDPAALTAVVRGRYQLASTRPGAAGSGEFPPEAQDDLRRASDAWQRYLATEPARVDPSLAQLMVNAYGEFGLKRPDRAAEAAEIVAEARPSSAAYLGLAQYATLAGQKRRADLAGQEALELAPGNQRSAVEKQLKALEDYAAKNRAPGGAPTPGAPAPGGAPSQP